MNSDGRACIYVCNFFLLWEKFRGHFESGEKGNDGYVSLFYAIVNLSITCLPTLYIK